MAKKTSSFNFSVIINSSGRGKVSNRPTNEDIKRWKNWCIDKIENGNEDFCYTASGCGVVIGKKKLDEEGNPEIHLIIVTNGYRTEDYKMSPIKVKSKKLNVREIT